MKVEFEIDDVELDMLLLEHLKQGIQDMKNPCGIPFFSYVPAYEERKVKKLKKAMRIVASWYGSGEDTEELLK